MQNRHRPALDFSRNFANIPRFPALESPQFIPTLLNSIHLFTSSPNSTT
jgi:hypothetical protein